MRNFSAQRIFLIIIENIIFEKKESKPKFLLFFEIKFIILKNN